jgi:metal-responsive CopG/Arc/MetJ family transcriptional regulator
MTGYTVMKTASWIPDDPFREIDACSRRLEVSRSRLFATVAREYLARHGTSADATTARNQGDNAKAPVLPAYQASA